MSDQEILTKVIQKAIIQKLYGLPKEKKTCYLHDKCFFDWMIPFNSLKDDTDFNFGKDTPFWRRHKIQDHIAVEELDKPFTGKITGPCTAIAKLHELRKAKKFKEADKIKEQYNILIYPGGYLALEKLW